MLQPHILLLLSPIFSHLKLSNKFSCITSPQRKFLKNHWAFSCILFQIFAYKSYRKGILVISCTGTHFSPYICLWDFLICLHGSSINSYLKIVLVLHLSQSGSVWVVLVLRGILVLSHQMIFWTERYFKIPHFGSLFVLVRFVVF